MHGRLLSRTMALVLVTLLTVATKVSAQNPDPECPPNSTTIWVYREFYGDPPGEILAIPFEMGTYPDDDPNDNEGELNNYVAGVLEFEIGGTAETALQDWQPQAARAVAVAGRTVGYDWCGIGLPDGHLGAVRPPRPRPVLLPAGTSTSNNGGVK